MLYTKGESEGNGLQMGTATGLSVRRARACSFLLQENMDSVCLKLMHLFSTGWHELLKTKQDLILQVLREYNHVNPQDEEETKFFLQSKVLNNID